jgi:hypothetical protein
MSHRKNNLIKEWKLNPKTGKMEYHERLRG